MRVLIAALVLVFAAGSALAQKKSEQERKAEAEIRKEQDRAYRASVQTIQDQNLSAVDPWNNMRGNAPLDGKKKQ